MQGRMIEIGEREIPRIRQGVGLVNAQAEGRGQDQTQDQEGANERQHRPGGTFKNRTA